MKWAILGIVFLAGCATSQPVQKMSAGSGVGIGKAEVVTTAAGEKKNVEVKITEGAKLF